MTTLWFAERQNPNDEKCRQVRVFNTQAEAQACSDEWNREAPHLRAYVWLDPRVQSRDKDEKLSLTFAEWQKVKALADERMKAHNGHSYVTILKTRCRHCGRSPRVKTRCGQWFHTFISELDTILLNLEREREAGVIS